MSTSTLEPIEVTRNIQLNGPLKPGYQKVLSPEALEFLAELHELYNDRRLELLENRKALQARLDAGDTLSFAQDTSSIRQADWNVGAVPKCLQDRRVEITGPVDRKMIINALNSGAKVFMADFEDSTSPTWENIIEGQLNLYDAVRRTLQFTSPEGKLYRLQDNVAVLKVRPRGWHLEEAHITFNQKPASASLVDFGLFVYHNAQALLDRQQGPYFYLPKLESHREARLWNNVFNTAEDYLGLERGTIKATVLIETISAAFEMDEILYELREHIVGLNAGRWDYIFSIIKKFRNNPAFVMPDRAEVTMGVPFMKAYAQELVRVCHKRGAHAIGGMSAFIPSKDEAVNKAAYEKVKADKEREASQGYDGTWVAHPKLVAVAKEVFDEALGSKPHQKDVMPPVQTSAKDLLNVAAIRQAPTEKGFRTNINVALLYLESWLNGTGAAALYNLMEDAATAEISRAQLWQWIHHRVTLADGQEASRDLYTKIAEEEHSTIRQQFDAQQKDTVALATARLLLDRLVLSPDFDEFLTLKAYLHIQ